MTPQDAEASVTLATLGLRVPVGFGVWPVRDGHRLIDDLHRLAIRIASSAYGEWKWVSLA